MRVPAMLAALALAPLAGCGSSPVVIDSLVMPATATVDMTDNQYHLQGTISFHDTTKGAVIKIVRLFLPMLSQTPIEKPIPGDPSMATNTPFVLLFDPMLKTMVPNGQVDYGVSLVDAQGAASDVKSETVTLQ